MLNNISKIWIINIALIAAVLFVYGGLNWFDSKNPEAIAVISPAKPNISWGEKISQIFSADKSSTKNQAENENVEYGYTQDGLKLPIAKDTYEDSNAGLEGSSDLTSIANDSQARLNQVVQEIAQLNHELSRLAAIQNQQPENEDNNIAIEDAEARLYALQNERESLMAQTNEKQDS